MADDVAIIFRKEAKEKGLKRYFTGKPCKRGHIAYRQTSNGCCSVCFADICRKFRSKHPEKIRDRVRKYAREHPEWKKQQDRKYFQKNKTKIVSKQKEYNKKNEELVRSIKRNYKRRNPEQARIDKHVRRAREAKSEGRYSKIDLKRIHKDQNYRCAYCPTSIKTNYHVDHINPLARGGSNWPKNIQLLCGPCNMKKNAKDPIDFMREMGRLL